MGINYPMHKEETLIINKSSGSGEVPDKTVRR